MYITGTQLCTKSNQPLQKVQTDLFFLFKLKVGISTSLFPVHKCLHQYMLLTIAIVNVNFCMEILIANSASHTCWSVLSEGTDHGVMAKERQN